MTTKYTYKYYTSLCGHFIFVTTIWSYATAHKFKKNLLCGEITSCIENKQYMNQQT